MFAATYDTILEECKCVPYFHTAAWEDYPRICAGEGLYCMNSVLRDIGSHTTIRNHVDVSKSNQNSTDSGNNIVGNLKFLYIRVIW